MNDISVRYIDSQPNPFLLTYIFLLVPVLLQRVFLYETLETCSPRVNTGIAVIGEKLNIAKQDIK